MTQKLNYNYDNFRILDMSTEACYQKIDPPSSCREPDMPSSACETDGNVEIVGGKGGWGANPLEFGSDPNHPGGLGSTCGIMCKSVRWTSSLRRLMRKSGIPNWTKSQPIPKPSWVEYGTNVECTRAL